MSELSTVSLNDALQWGAVAAIIAIVVVRIAKRFLRSRNEDSGCHSGCEGCSLADSCSKPRQISRRNTRRKSDRSDSEPQP